MGVVIELRPKRKKRVADLSNDEAILLGLMLLLILFLMHFRLKSLALLIAKRVNATYE